MTSKVDLIPIIVERERATMPSGFDSWGIKSVRPDLKAYRGYQWPSPFSIAYAKDVDLTNDGPCPRRPGDGLCVATNWSGMASGGIPARTLLLVAYNQDDVLTYGPTVKMRCSRVAVVAIVDGERLVRECGQNANLYGADLRVADLQGADLYGASLRGASLRGANLRVADLQGADLYGASLSRANLYGADLRDVNLQSADLQGADLRGAILHRANLRGARGVDPSGAHGVESSQIIN